MVSQATMDEFATVIARVQPKGYVKPNEAIALIRAYKECAEWVPILERIVACRDPKDDKFLELAVNGKADYLVTGDQDLLILHPFRDIRILTAKAFIDSLLS
jgi:putative PIN family toxin of toxin-antitoxin system